MNVADMTLTPAQASQALEHFLLARKNLLLVGQPGVGKTALVKQAAAKLGWDLVVTHPAVEDPTVPAGLPWPDAASGQARFLPYGQLASLLSATRPTVWFVDDLGQGDEGVQKAYMQYFGARMCGEHRLPDCVALVAATNRRTDRAGVAGILEPVKSRFTAILHLRPTLQDWCDWAFGAGVAPELVAFARAFERYLTDEWRPGQDMENTPSPRTFEAASDILRMGLPEPLLLPCLAGAVGKPCATDLVAYLRLFRNMPNPDHVLMDPDAAPLPDTPGVKYALCAALVRRVNGTNWDRVARYAERLAANGSAPFATLLVRDCTRKDAALTQSATYVRLMTGPLGALISGSKH